MQLALLIVYLLLCVSVLLWVWDDTRRILSAPFQFAAVSLCFILPQLFALWITKRFPEDVAAQFTLYCISAFIALVAGVWSYAPPRGVKSDKIELDERRFATLAKFVSLLGLIGFGYFQYISLADYSANIVWRGWPVYFYALAKLLIPALVFWRLLYLFYGRQKYHFAAMFIAIPVIGPAINSGRRSWAIMFVIAWFVPAILTGKIRLQYWYGLAAVGCAFVIITLFPAYRGELKRDGFSGLVAAIQKTSPREVMSRIFEEGTTLEVADAIMCIEMVKDTGGYSYGLRFVESLVQNFVPGGIIGHELKDRLRTGVLRYEKLNQHSTAQSKWVGPQGPKEYTSKTGFTDSFAEFSWGGLILYYLLGRWHQRLYVHAVEWLDRSSIIVFGFVGFFPASIVYGEWSFSLVINLLPSALSWLAYKYCVKRSVPMNVGRRTSLDVLQRT